MEQTVEEFVTFPVAWAVLTLVVAGIAQGKGRSGFGWFIAALFLGPIALLILLFVDNRERPTS